MDKEKPFPPTHPSSSLTKFGKLREPPKSSDDPLNCKCFLSGGQLLNLISQFVWSVINVINFYFLIRWWNNSIVVVNQTNESHSHISTTHTNHITYIYSLPTFKLLFLLLLIDEMIRVIGYSHIQLEELEFELDHVVRLTILTFVSWARIWEHLYNFFWSIVY